MKNKLSLKKKSPCERDDLLLSIHGQKLLFYIDLVNIGKCFTYQYIN